MICVAPSQGHSRKERCSKPCPLHIVAFVETNNLYPSQPATKKMSADVVKELVADTEFICNVNTFIVKVLKTYSEPNCEGNQGSTELGLITARGLFLADVGRFMLKVERLFSIIYDPVA
jgi:hypothetical protein